MDNVIYGVFDPKWRQIIQDIHFNKDAKQFKSANEIAEITGLRLSVVKAIIKRTNKTA